MKFAKLFDLEDGSQVLAHLVQGDNGIAITLKTEIHGAFIEAQIEHDKGSEVIQRQFEALSEEAALSFRRDVEDMWANHVKA